jgi:periplasmic copper chaperone A
MLKHFTLALVTLGLFMGLALAQSGSIEVDHVWARATPGGAKTGAIYLTIANKGGAPDKLLSASTPAAGLAQVHSMSMDNGVMKMRPVASLDLKPGETTELKPGGLHIMLMQLKGPLVEGKSVPLTLTFEKAGKVDVTATVEKPGAMGPAAMPGMKM